MASGKNSTSHTSTNLAENVREDFDEENAECEIFLYQEKALDTVDYDILLAKHSHYRIGGV